MPPIEKTSGFAVVPICVPGAKINSLSLPEKVLGVGVNTFDLSLNPNIVLLGLRAFPIIISDGVPPENPA